MLTLTMLKINILPKIAQYYYLIKALPLLPLLWAQFLVQLFLHAFNLYLVILCNIKRNFMLLNNNTIYTYLFWPINLYGLVLACTYEY